MSCRHQWAGAIIKGPVNHILVDQCEKCGKLRLQNDATPAQGIAPGNNQAATHEPNTSNNRLTQSINLGKLRALAEKFEGYGDEEIGDAFSGPYYQCAEDLRGLIRDLDTAPGVGNG